MCEKCRHGLPQTEDTHLSSVRKFGNNFVVDPGQFSKGNAGVVVVCVVVIEVEEK